MNTQLKREDFRSQLSEQLTTAATRILRGFVKIFMGRMTFDVMVDLLRQVMVEEGSRRIAAENDGKVILSRVSLLTGIRTQAIKDIQRQQSESTSAPHDLTIEGRILAIWSNDKQYLDPKTGQPMELIIHGGGCTFQRLVSSVAGRGVTTQTVLERLEASGNVEVVNEHWVRLVNPRWIYIQNFQSQMLEAGSFNAENHLTTLQHNLDTPDERWTERSVWSVSAPAELVPELREVLNEALKDYYHKAAALIREREVENMSQVNETLSGVGFYYWQRDEQQHKAENRPFLEEKAYHSAIRPIVVKEKGNDDVN
ncbi:MAG: DUF6502 family protein [Xanthomonadales bacterium]|nr:DUF6502 family protein [Xanthomonadales bacterium]